MKTRLLSIILGMTLPICAQGTISKTETPQPLVEGTSFHFQSKLLGEKRAIYVFLPGGYATSTETYPVLYVLDAETQFYHTTGIVDLLSGARRIPEMIVVGIPSGDFSQRTRDLSHSSRDHKEDQLVPAGNQGERFTRFIGDELIPHIDSRFRTDRGRILAGKSRAGLFTMNVMLRAPDLFNGYISVSPVLGWDHERTYDLAKSLFAHESGLDKYLYLSMATESLGNMNGITLPVERFARLLGTHAPKNLDWTYQIHPEENHGSISHLSYYQGLLAIYDSWRPVYFKDLAEFRRRGGISYVRTNYKKITKLGYASPKILPGNHLIAIAKLFRREKEFEALWTFIENERDVDADLLRRVGSWFLHWPENHQKEAIPYFELWAKRHPKTSGPWFHLSKAHADLGHKESSDKYYAKAIAVGVENADPHLARWKSRFPREN